MKLLFHRLSKVWQTEGRKRRVAVDALNRLIDVFPDASGALIAINTKGEIGAARINYNNWTYLLRSAIDDNVVITTIDCNQPSENVVVQSISLTLLVITFGLL